MFDKKLARVAAVRSAIAAALLVFCGGVHAQVKHPEMAQAVQREEQALLATARAPLPVPQDWAALQRTLPTPLQRYFAYTLASGPRATLPPVARLTLTGEVRIPTEAGTAGVSKATPWMAHEGREIITLSQDNAGFLWNSHWLRPDGRGLDVRDKYEGGNSHILVKLDGTQALIDEAGDAQDRHDFLIRLFGEATQVPPYLLPSRLLQWRALNADQAVAVLSDGAVKAEMTCTFAASGALEKCEATKRMLRVSSEGGSTRVAAAWTVERSGYQEMAGLRVPTRGLVSWSLGGQRWEQVRLELRQLDLGGPR